MQKDLLHLFPLMSPSQSVKRGKAGSSIQVEMDGRTKHVQQNTKKTTFQSGVHEMLPTLRNV